MKEQLSLLIELQQIDSATVKILQKNKALPDRLAKLDEEFADVSASFEESKNKVTELVKRHKEKEDELKKGQETLKKTKARQFEVKTNKEYEAILKEIVIIEGKNGQVEDQIIALLDEIDRSKTGLTDREKEFKTLQKKHEAEKKAIEAEMGGSESELQLLQQQGHKLREKIKNDLLKRYEAIKGINNGLAVVPAWKEVCQGCYMNMPPQFYNELQKTANLLSCPNCNRIIYWDNREKANP